MSLLTLRDIGKIYVSEGNVSVGIRGVSLSFDRGEFVAVTGKSGSGKSTLLNVISGMDSYEEGELYAEGEPTSHYLQPDWEEYRQKYISFIFQDYNIIESFTVLQNVELALMHIEDKKERRARAMALIRRVGLASHASHKGSKLSGGQKQRTVIARALAKDSPIILADEPTGNLDSATSEEILALLKEVSKDKLLIVVTHSFDQVEKYATRHIRIFDGAVETDHTIRAPLAYEKKESEERAEKKGKAGNTGRQIKNGFTLGRALFTAKPKLSLFLCFLMLIGTMGIFLVTSLCGDVTEPLGPHYMFNHIDGRLVLAKQNGTVFTDEELEELVKEYGALGYLHYDALLDEGTRVGIVIPTREEPGDWTYPPANAVYGKDYGEDIVGRYPTAKDEVFLYLPISYRPAVGEDSLLISEILYGRTAYKPVGVKYYYDNNLTPECLFTEEGFRVATATHFLSDCSDVGITVVLESEKDLQYIDLYQLTPSFSMPDDKVYVDSAAYRALTGKADTDNSYTATVSYTARYYRYNYYNGTAKHYSFETFFSDADITSENPLYGFESFLGGESLVISDELLCQIAESVLSDSYVQASLFFESDRAAHEAAKKLGESEYLAVPSDTTYDPGANAVIEALLACLGMACVWALSIVFLAFFVSLCSSRALSAFKGDLAIMRSMGIPVKVIRIGMYVRMMFSLLPAFVLVVLSAILIFTTPGFNEHFVYLYGWQYALIFIGMLGLTVKTTHTQVRKLFGESVKKALKGGKAE